MLGQERYRLIAKHELNHPYMVEFVTFERHAEKHLDNRHQRWGELLTPEVNALAYREFIYGAMQQCYDFPRYLRCWDSDRKYKADGSGPGVPLTADSIWKKPKEAVYAAHNSGVLIAALILHESILVIRTAYRVGKDYDPPFKRVYRLKGTVARMIEGQHKEHFLDPIRFYEPATWATTHR